jgi:hypothetical protein
MSGLVIAGYAFSWWIPVVAAALLVVAGSVMVRFLPSRGRRNQ